MDDVAVGTVSGAPFTNFYLFNGQTVMKAANGNSVLVSGDLQNGNYASSITLPPSVSGIFRIEVYAYDGVGYSVLEVITEIEKVFGGRLERIIANPRAGDPAVLLAAVGKAKNELGWAPGANLSQIVLDSWLGVKQLG